MKKLIATVALGAVGLLGLTAPADAAQAPTPQQVAAKLAAGPQSKVEIKIYPGGKVRETRDGKVVRDDRLGKRDAVTAGPFEDHMFYWTNICIRDGAGTTWPFYAAGNSWEGTNTLSTGYRTWQQGCADFGGNQTLNTHTYNENDGACVALSGNQTPVSRTYTNYVWSGADGGPKVFFNLSASTAACRADNQRKSYYASQGIGKALGAAVFTNPYTASIMNTTWWDTYSTAGTFDRNNMWSLGYRK